MNRRGCRRAWRCPKRSEIPQHAGVGEFLAERRPGVDKQVGLFARLQRRAHGAARVALDRQIDLFEVDVRVGFHEALLERADHVLLAAAGPIQKHQVTTDVRRPDRPNHEKDDRGSSEE